MRDTGVGIAPDLLLKVFDLFTQVPRTLAQSQSRLGIGLRMVRRFEEQQAGTVEAHSDGPGQGSAFLVHLAILESEIWQEDGA